MTEEIGLHGWTYPVPYDESDEDEDEWASDLSDHAENELDKAVPLRGSESERPSAGTYPGLIWIVDDPTPIEITYDNGSNWVVIGTTNADTLDGNDSGSFAIKDNDETIGGNWDFQNAIAGDITGDAGTVDGYEGSDLAALSENETVGGSWTYSSEQTFDGGINGSLTDDTALTNLLGNNLSIDGSGNLDVSETTTLYMSDYASSGGVVDSEFDTAISDATAGDTIVFDHNTYELNTSHTISKTLTIDATTDSVIQCTNTSNNNPHIHFQGGGIQNNTTTSSAIIQGDRVIPVDDTSIFSADDRVLIMQDQHSSQVDTKIQFDMVESVDGTNGEITLMGAAYKEFNSGSYVYQVDLLDSPSIRNIETEGGGTRHLEFQWCERPTYRDISVSEYLEVSVYALECWKPIYENVEVTDPEGVGSGEGEPIALYRSTDGYIEAPRVYDCRRGIDFAWGAHTHAIVDPVIRGVQLNGISVHQDNQSGSLMITGGEIVCDPNGQTGNGITGSSSAKMYIDGIRIVARENGIICNGQTRITNVTVTPVEGVTDPQQSGFNIKYGDTSIRDSYIDDPDGYFEFPVWVDGGGSSNTKHIVIDVEITHEGQNHVYLDARDGGIEKVKIRGFIRNLNSGGTGSQALFLRADGSSTISHVDINMDITDFPNQAIRMLSSGTEQIAGVNLHDSYISCGKAAIFDDGSGTFGSIRVHDCHVDTGSTSLSFDDSITKLFVTNNDVSGSIDTSGVGSSNKTVSGNL